MAVELSTRTKAIYAARDLLQTLGFNGFSFQHVADRLNIKKQSLYAHFQSKEELGLDLIETYTTEFANWITTIEIFEPEAKIGALFEMFYKFARDDRKFCPINALSADYNSLPKAMQKALTRSMRLQRAAIERMIQEGQKAKVFRRDMSVEHLASALVAMAYGSQQSGRAFNDPEEIRSIKKVALQFIREKK